MNDRSLRNNVIALGGRTNGQPRETGFDITAASEVMALMAVTRDLEDLRERLGKITIGYSRDGKPITAEDLGAAGAMTVLLKDALNPNLVQTLEGQPCLMHTGPFANIASGNNSLVADRIGMKVADYIVTESGFGADMGMEKFFDIVCRFGDLTPSAVVLVCTVRAIRHHAGGDDGDLEEGFANVAHHLQTITKFGLPAVVAVNRRPGDSDEDVEAVRQLALKAGAHGAEINEGFEQGGKGVAKLAEAVVAACDAPSDFKLLYPDDASIAEKIEAVATEVYGADGVTFAPLAQQKIEQFTKDGLAHFPVCMAKTQLSLSADPKLLGAPKGFEINIRDIRAYTGAGWLVPLCGDIMQMPGLGATPAAQNIDIDSDGNTVGLF
jgi:formate--tetrahydrofolate ligase